jgi:hypothetical protein
VFIGAALLLAVIGGGVLILVWRKVLAG